MSSTEGAPLRALPAGWEWRTLGSLGEYHNGRGFKKSEWRETGRPIIRIQNLTDPTKPFNRYEGEAEARNVVRDGDILVSWAATLDVFRWSGEEAVLNQHIFKVDSFISPDLHYWLIKAALDQLRAQAHGTGMVHITRKPFMETRVPLPSEPVQETVVQELERAMSSVEEGATELAQTRRAIRQYRTAALASLFEDAWPRVPLRSVLQSLRNGIFVSRPAVDPPGIPILRISAVRPLELRLEDIRYAPADTPHQKDFALGEGDILFTRYSGNPNLVGACAIVHELNGPTLYPDKLIRAVVDQERAIPDYIALACSTGQTLTEIRERRKTTAGQVGIAGGQLGTVSLPLPSLEDQQCVVQQAAEILRNSVALATAVERAGQQVDQLRRAVLAHTLKLANE